ncbi:GerAB/ArcD/ProY family transporter [Cohnella sp. GCM10020058]|uniref:GerAB/ArcD/ProY family transporter n=1 Tax=Cohnella sp. GCM10020058 TaxID=3317330 RepID=UPI0036300320
MGLQSVTQSQLFKLFALHLFSTMVAFMLGIMLQSSGYNAPLGVLSGAMLGLAYSYFAYKLGLRRPDRFFIEYGQDIVGRWLHYPLLLFIALSNLLIAIINFWELQDVMIQFYLISTPPWAIAALCGLCVAYTVRFGIKSVFRAAEGLFFISLLSFLLIPFLVSENFHWFSVRGIATYFNMQEAWPSAYYTSSVFGEMSFTLLVFPYLHSPGKTFRTLVASTSVAAAVVLLHIIPLLLIFGPELSSNLNYPELELLRFMRSGSFLETLDPALIALWLISIFVKLAFIVYVIALILARSFRLKDTKPFVFPITVFIAVCSLVIVKSNTQFRSMLGGGILTVFWISELIPIVYYLVDTVRRSWSQREEAASE